MEALNERFRIVFKQSGLSQEKFAERINRSRGEVANIIYDKTILKDDILKAVCEKFAVREDWLRNGIEPMYSPKTREEEIAELVAQALDGDSNLKKAVIQMICTRTDQQLRDLEDALVAVYEGLKRD